MSKTHTRRLTAFILPVLLVTGCAAGGAEADPQSEVATSVLGPETRMGAVELLASDLEAMRTFYVDLVGLRVLHEDAAQVTLGAGEQELLRIVRSDFGADDPRQAGLYHSAFLYADAPTLAAALLRIASAAPGLFQGSSDHRVSQALYFSDPEGNGVELYVDRPRDTWEWNGGLVTMGSEVLDPNAFIEQHLDPTAEAAPGTGIVMGHVHLRGGDVRAAEEFYEDALGFGVTSRSDGAVFFSAGGYHHHLAVNTWNSAGAASRPESRGLGSVRVEVAEASELDALAERLDERDLPFARGDGEIIVADPWGTNVVVQVSTGR